MYGHLELIQSNVIMVVQEHEGFPRVPGTADGGDIKTYVQCSSLANHGFGIPYEEVQIFKDTASEQEVIPPYLPQLLYGALRMGMPSNGISYRMSVSGSKLLNGARMTHLKKRHVARLPG